MNYHDIRTDDMLNGEGLRVVLFVSGCNHYCYNCQNPQTWDCNNGIPFTKDSINEILEKLNKDYISGLTLSGGDPLNENNIKEVLKLCKIVKDKYPDKTIWLYTGYKWEQLILPIITDDLSLIRDNNVKMRLEILQLCDVLVDGKYVESLNDINYAWAGSTNQRVIDVKKTLDNNNIPVLYCE